MAATSPSRPSATIAARIDRLPPSRHVHRLVTLIAFAGFFELYDLFMTGYIAPGLIKTGLFTETTKGLFGLTGFAGFVGAGFAGMFVGTLVGTWFSDRYGRRTMFLFSLLWYSITTLFMSFQPSAIEIEVWRVLAGVGIGVQLVTVDTFVSEISPKDMRGYFVSYAQFIAFCSVPVVAYFAYLVMHPTVMGPAGWRWVSLAGALGAIYIVFVYPSLPESPRWYESRGRLEEAEEITAAMEKAVEAEIGRPLPEPHKLSDEDVYAKGSWFEIWSPQYMSRTIMLLIFNFIQTLGYYGFAAWLPILLLHEGVSFIHSLEYSFLIALLNPVGPLLSMKFADSFERKWQIVWLSVAIAVFGLIFAQMRNPALLILFGALITLSNNWFACAFHTFQAELYPTRIRAQAVGFVYSWSRFSAIFTGFIVAAVLKSYGTSGVFALIAGAMVLVAIVVAALGPKTARVRLEAISH